MALWAVLSAYTLLHDFEVAAPVTIGLCAIALYIVMSDAAIRLLRSLKS
jgi:phosphatidylcholine synthase